MWYNDALPYLIETLGKALYHTLPLNVVASGQGALDIVERLCHPYITVSLSFVARQSASLVSEADAASERRTLRSSRPSPVDTHVLLCIQVGMRIYK